MLISAGCTRMRKRRFRTPKMRSITLRADACRKLKSSSALTGLQSDIRYYSDIELKKLAPLLGPSPFCKMIPHTTFRNNECVTYGKPSVCKIIFIGWDMEVCHASIVEHCGVRCRSIPSTEYIIEDHIKPTNGKAVLCNAAFAITSCLTHFCGSTTVDMSSVDRTEGVLEKGVVFRIV